MLAVDRIIDGNMIAGRQFCTRVGEEAAWACKLKNLHC
jgi:hypothetical protein